MRAPVRTSLCAVALALAAACSGGDGDDGGDDRAQATTGTAGDPATGTAGGTATATVDTDGTRAPDAAPPATTRATVPEVGVPGLESTDAVCRAWSRFGGSFQVVAVAAAFGEGGPAAAAALEVTAAPTVARAYDDLLAAWPAELAGERDVVADDYLGPFARRARRALDALVAAGATGADVDAIATSWEAALAERDPTDPALEVALDDARRELVAIAATTFAAEVPPVGADPDLVVTASTPGTDAYLAASCPDQGTLSGEPTG